MIQIPFIEYPSYKKEVVLDGQTYIFKFVWNTRGEFWTMSIFDTSNNAIIQGVKLVLNYSLIADYHHLDIPQGQLYVIDVTDDVSKIQYEDFTNERQLQLIYKELADSASV